MRCVVLLLAAVSSAMALAEPPRPAPRSVDFRRDIYPVLKTRCFQCHSGEDASSGVRLDQRAEWLGENSGKPLAIPGDSGQSRALQLVAGLDAKLVMPAKGDRLSAEHVGLLRAWIDQGLAWDDDLLPATRITTNHWAFQPMKRPPLPRVKNRAWLSNPIDAFIAAQHEAHGLTPTPAADRRTLLRRLALDLTGLPPTADEIDAFVADQSANAYERQVDRLLGRPAHGERWARHWLDVVRWADSEGYESDHIRPYAWRYRDYVVRSFNSDKPFDRFLMEQLAGDEMQPYSDDNLIATGFLAAARLSSNEEDKSRQRNDVLVDIVNATGQAILGLTIHCAQCHNHKFDPITARDYYRFMGFFVRGMPNNLTLRDPSGWRMYEAAKPKEYDILALKKEKLFAAAKERFVSSARKQMTNEQRKALDLSPDRRSPVQERLSREADLLLQFTTAQVERQLTDAERKEYDDVRKRLEEFEKKMPDKPQTFGFYSPATSPHRLDVLPMRGFYPPPFDPTELRQLRASLLLGGDVRRRGPSLDAGFPEVFRVAASSGARSELAHWLTRPEHPLTARVWVNRLWQWHFGSGLVNTPNDFGTRGAPPTHPELLDWLACELISSGWSTRHIHRLILTSNTYRQGSQFADLNEGAASTKSEVVRRKSPSSVDPGNRFYWRWTVRRMEVEAIRDSMLAVSGELDMRSGGPSDADETASRRRTLYLLQKRQKAPQVQALFDGPAAATESCARRTVSTAPLQALYMLNSSMSMQRAEKLAARVRQAAGDDRRRTIDVAFRLALARSPTSAEHIMCEKFLAEGSLTLFCQALLNTNEFVYLE